MGDDTGSSGRYTGTRRARLVAIAGVACVLSLVAACGSDDDGGGTTEAADLGAAIGEAQSEVTTTAPSNQGSVSIETTTTIEGAETRPVPELDAPTIPAEASPPTTAPGTEAIDWPIGLEETIPIIGEIVVDLEPGSHADFPVMLTQGNIVAVISAADDGILTDIQIFRPDGAVEGSWQGGEPGVINGWEWVAADDRVPITGAWVFRVIHLGGGDEPFVLRFFGQA